jgi:hypothetical protein
VTSQVATETPRSILPQKDTSGPRRRGYILQNWKLEGVILAKRGHSCLGTTPIHMANLGPRTGGRQGSRPWPPVRLEMGCAYGSTARSFLCFNLMIVQACSYCTPLSRCVSPCRIRYNQHSHQALFVCNPLLQATEPQINVNSATMQPI